MLDQFRGRVPAIPNAPVGQRVIGDVNALATYWSRPGVWRGGSRLDLDRSYAYLDSLQPFALRHAGLAIAVAGAYRQLAVLQEPYARDAALSAYSASALLYSRWLGADPGLRNDLVWVAGRVQGLGGTLPFLAGIPFGGPPRTPDGFDAVRMNARPLPVPELPERVIWPAGAKAPAELRAQFESVAASVDATYLAVQPIRESVASLGQSLHPDTLADLSRMQAMLELARQEILEGAFEDARQNLQIAGALAKRVGKQFGR